MNCRRWGCVFAGITLGKIFGMADFVWWHLPVMAASCMVAALVAPAAFEALCLCLWGKK